MGYDSYRDANGVTWTVVWPASRKGHQAIATVMDTADPRYDPEPEDITVSMAEGGVQLGPIDIVPSGPATGEQQRTLFIELVGKIADYAKAHRGPQVTLKVTASPGVPWWVYVGAVVVLLAKRR